MGYAWKKDQAGNSEEPSEEVLDLLERWNAVFEDMLDDPNEDVMRHEIRIAAMEEIEQTLAEEHDYYLDVRPTIKMCDRPGSLN